MKKVFILAFFLLSCTHWLIETQTRIRVENLTDDVINDLCIVSKSGLRDTLVKESIESKGKSSVKEIEWAGEFNFMVYARDDWQPLGIHKLKGGSVLARITEKDGKFEMVLKYN